MQRIHIVGTGPRTGTTLLAEAMKCCFDIDRATEHEGRIWDSPSSPGKVYLNKAPYDTVYASLFLRVIPNLSVICLCRDPRDTACSIHGKDKEHYFSGLKAWRVYSPRVRELLGDPRFILIRYEDLVSDPDSTQAYLERRLPFLERRHPFSRYHEVCVPSEEAALALNSVRPISPSGIGAWRQHKARLAGQIAQVGSIVDDLIEWDYEKDGKWMDELAGVTPDFSPSHLQTRRRWGKRYYRRLYIYSQVAKILLKRACGKWY